MQHKSDRQDVVNNAAATLYLQAFVEAGLIELTGFKVDVKTCRKCLQENHRIGITYDENETGKIVDILIQYPGAFVKLKPMVGEIVYFEA